MQEWLTLLLPKMDDSERLPIYLNSDLIRAGIEAHFGRQWRCDERKQNQASGWPEARPIQRTREARRMGCIWTVRYSIHFIPCDGTNSGAPRVNAAIVVTNVICARDHDNSGLSSVAYGLFTPSRSKRRRARSLKLHLCNHCGSRPFDVEAVEPHNSVDASTR